MKVPAEQTAPYPVDGPPPSPWRPNMMMMLLASGVVTLAGVILLCLAQQYELAVAVASPYIAMCAAWGKDLINPDQGQVPGTVAHRLISLIEWRREADTATA